MSGWRGLIQLCRSTGVRVALEPREQLTRLAKTDAHQGVVAVVKEREFLSDRGSDGWPKAEGEHRFFLALDGVEDPHNFGALLRTADGAGVDGVIVPERRSAPVTGTVAKTSAGAIGACADCAGDEYGAVAGAVEAEECLGAGAG